MAAAVTRTPFRVLLVEDKPESADATLSDVARIIDNSEAIWEKDAAAALVRLGSESFDLAICDLKLPARADLLATSEANGLEVVSTLESDHAGTPVIILSAHASVPNTEARTSSAKVGPVFGVPLLSMCQVAVKGNQEDFERRLNQIADGLHVWDSISIESASDVSDDLVRAVQHFASHRGYLSATVERANGLSGSINAFVKFTGGNSLPINVFLKINEARWMDEEVRHEHDFVEGHLQPGDWAPKLETMRAGLRSRAASFSSVATSSSFFTEMRTTPLNAKRTIETLETVVEPWSMSAASRQSSVGELRREHLSDEDATQLQVDLKEFDEYENSMLLMETRVIHGDLHGENVLVKADGRPLLIDFAYTGVGPSVADPITLEMALLFHPDTPISDDYLALVDYSAWATGDYMPDDTYSPYILACREWAARGRTEAEMFAFAYAHALRHLKHQNAGFDRVMAVARSIVGAQSAS